jgi:NADH-quinone oxidoreductase subunit F
VFEKLPLPGGMMTFGIPEYRLPRGPLFAEIENIERAGVQIRCNMTLGREFTLDDLLKRDGFNAVLLAVGAHNSRRLGIPGEDKQGDVHGTDFLRRIAFANHQSPTNKGVGSSIAGSQQTAVVNGKRVAIVGGGDVAVDAARSAWRLGASEVHVIYRRQRQDMPAHAEEVEAAVNEGIQFHFMANPIRVLGDGHVTGVAVQRQRLADFDISGRRRPVPVDVDEFALDVEVLIPAIGQTTDLTWINGEGIETTKADRFAVNEAFTTTCEGVFAAGDSVSGPATVIQAVAQGNLVAEAIDHWLRTGMLIKPHYKTPRPDIPQVHNLEDYAYATRPAIPELKIVERRGNFREVELGFNEQTACEEAKRCLRCDLEWLDLMEIDRPQADMDFITETESNDP